jgi:hypothetical protein
LDFYYVVNILNGNINLNEYMYGREKLREGEGVRECERERERERDAEMSERVSFVQLDELKEGKIIEQ